MLNVMRKHAKSWVVSLMIAAISIVFIFYFGTGSWRQQDVTQAARVNGEIVGVAEYQQRYKRLLDLAESQYGEMLNDELLGMLDLKRRAMDELVEEYLVVQKAREMGLVVTAGDIQTEITRQPYFLVDGVFNEQQYRGMVARLGMTPGEFEASVGQDLLKVKVRETIGSMAHVSENETKEFFHLMRDKVNLDFAVFRPEVYREMVSPTEEQTQEYFARNRERYRVPVQARIAYIAFRPSDFTSAVQITEDDLADYYEFNLDSFSHPDQAKASHILFRVGPDAPEETVAEVRGKAEEVLKEIRAGENVDFAEMAREYSEDPAASEGGDLGWFDRDQMVPEFSEAAFKLEKGQVSDLVRTQFGFHIIKLEDKREAGRRSLDDVREEIEAKLAMEKAADLAGARAEDVYEQITLSQDFEATAAKLELTPVTTPWFNELDPPQDLGADPNFIQTLLELREGETGPLLERDDGLYIVKSVARQDSYLPELEKVRGAVEEDTAQELADALARKAAGEFLTESKGSEGWEGAVRNMTGKALAEPGQPEADVNLWSGAGILNPGGGARTASFKYDTGETGPFTRNEPVPGIGQSRELAEAASSLSPGAVADRPYETPQGWVVFRLKEKVPASDEDYAGEKENLARALQVSKEQAYYREWIETLRDQSEIEVDERLLS